MRYSGGKMVMTLSIVAVLIKRRRRRPRAQIIISGGISAKYPEIKWELWGTIHQFVRIILNSDS
jgi:hypothetical protein